LKFGSEHERHILVAVSEDFVIYKACKPDSVVDLRVVCVTDDEI